jgi:hypothetical protein
MKSTPSYLQTGRLADVLALIQVLAYDRETYRSEDGLCDELQRQPLEGKNWIALAREHPEFFRVREEKEERTVRAALLARYVLEYEKLADGDEKRPPLDVTVTNKLMELAIQLHDKQLERASRWKTTMLPMFVATIAAGASITAALIGLAKPNSASPQQIPVVNQNSLTPAP